MSSLRRLAPPAPVRSLLRAALLAALCALPAAFAAADTHEPAEPATGAAAEETLEAAETRSGTVLVATIRGSINPASSDYLQRAIRQAEEERAAALLIELDTPGGLVAATKDIIQAMLGAEVPIIVYVAPRGAWAGSAGTFITMAAHVAAMAPGSSIGAAHPVGLGGSGPPPTTDEEGKQQPADYSTQKAENLLVAFIESIARERERNVEWAAKAVRESVAVTADEAKELNVVDLVAEDRADLFRQADGRVVKVGGKPVALAIANAPQTEIEMGAITRLLNVITDPNVAVLLLIAGVLGLYIEFNQPGLLIPGIAGGVCLILAMIAMQILPFSWLGLLLIMAGVGLIAAEVFVTSYGALFASGVVCFLLGGMMLFDEEQLLGIGVSFWSVLVPAVATFALLAGLALLAVGRTLRRGQVAGAEEMVGMQAVARSPLAPDGTVFVHGELWQAHAAEPIGEGEPVEIIAVEGLRLRVQRAPESP